MKTMVMVVFSGKKNKGIYMKIDFFGAVIRYSILESGQRSMKERSGRISTFIEEFQKK